MSAYGHLCTAIEEGFIDEGEFYDAALRWLMSEDRDSCTTSLT